MTLQIMEKKMSSYNNNMKSTLDLSSGAEKSQLGAVGDTNDRGFPMVNINQLVSVPPLQPEKFLVREMHKVEKQEWQPTYIIEDIGLPSLVESHVIQKIFKIQVLYKDTQTGKQFSKTHYFGEPDDYIFSKNIRQRTKLLSRLKNTQNPLHPNYWRAHICLSGEDMKSNYHKLCDFILDRRLSQLNLIRRGIKSGQGQKKPNRPQKK